MASARCLLRGLYFDTWSGAGRWHACQETVVMMRSLGLRASAAAEAGKRAFGKTQAETTLGRAERCQQTPVGINAGAGAVMIVVAALIAAPIPQAHEDWRLAVMSTAAGLFAALTLDHVALPGVIVLGWLVLNGFLVNRLGNLSWHGTSDVRRLLLLAMSGGLGLGVGEACRRARRLRAEWRMDAEIAALTPVNAMKADAAVKATVVKVDVVKEEHGA